jgi:hypothetical protein
MTKQFVDFQLVKEAVDMQMALDHYGIKGLVKRGEELRGPCPIHKGAQQSKNFTVNTRKNAFKCFSAACGARGNVLDFVAAMERCSIRDAALKLQECFAIGDSETTLPEEREAIDEAPEISRGIYSDRNGALFEVVTTAISGEDFQALVVYRELFGDYRFFVAPPENFGTADAQFTLVKAL